MTRAGTPCRASRTCRRTGCCEIETFFRTYKTLERRPTDVRGWLDVEDAWRIIDAAMTAGTQPSDVAPGTWR